MRKVSHYLFDRLVMPVLILALVLSSGCSSLPSLTDPDNSSALRLTMQYATLKVIEESDSFTAQDVADKAAELQAKVESSDSLVLERLRSEFYESIDYEGLPPSDRLLVAALTAQFEHSLQDFKGGGSVLSEAQRVQVMTLLTWVEDAAVLAGARHASRD